MIIGITGTPGAGKGAVVSYLVSQKGFIHYSVRDFLAEKMEERGISVNRDTMIDFANELRAKYGPQHLFDELYARALSAAAPAVIESIRAIGEAEALKKQGGILISIDADIKTRYARIHGRGSALDAVTFDEFKVQELREMHSFDPNKQNIRQVMAMADYRIDNNGSLKELHHKLKVLLEEIDHV